MNTLNREGISAGPNRLGLAGIEFIEYVTQRPQALGRVLEDMGFQPVARHRSREVVLYRQGSMNLVVNATPLGMSAHDPLPTDLGRLHANTWVAEVVMSATPTPLVQRALQLGCPLQMGTDMLFEQIPAYLEFFGLPSTTPEHLRELAKLKTPERSMA